MDKKKIQEKIDAIGWHFVEACICILYWALDVFGRAICVYLVNYLLNICYDVDQLSIFLWCGIILIIDLIFNNEPYKELEHD